MALRMRERATIDDCRSRHAPPQRHGPVGASSGQALVEFALTAVVFLALVFGVLEFGRAIYAYSVVANTAREAARFAAAHPGEDAAAHVASLAVGVDVEIEVAPITAASTEVIVTARHRFGALTPFVPDMDMASTARAYLEIH
ncbi:MAG: TadE/TadG family type IV pilus assembly protein [Anaerolineae bacterium]